jgi:inorganic pyrophosphatase
MTETQLNHLFKLLGNVYKPHPWHGVDIRDEEGSEEINAYIEIVPADTCKYEMDKKSGYLKVDRPHKFSNNMPCLYGFVPKTYSDERIAEYTRGVLNRPELVGDGDALDICVLTERNITHGDLFVNAIVIGGFRMIDHGEVDDKIIAVLKDDAVFGGIKDISEVSKKVVDRMLHYFLTYKQIPADGEKPKIEITDVYGKEEALRILEISALDYTDHYKFDEMKASLLS